LGSLPYARSQGAPSLRRAHLASWHTLIILRKLCEVRSVPHQQEGAPRPAPSFDLPNVPPDPIPPAALAGLPQEDSTPKLGEPAEGPPIEKPRGLVKKCITCRKKVRPCGPACVNWPGHSSAEAGPSDAALDSGLPGASSSDLSAQQHPAGTQTPADMPGPAAVEGGPSTFESAEATKRERRQRDLDAEDMSRGFDARRDKAVRRLDRCLQVADEHKMNVCSSIARVGSLSATLRLSPVFAVCVIVGGGLRCTRLCASQSWSHYPHASPLSRCKPQTARLLSEHRRAKT
jgi:hypothetical protein